MSCTEKNPLVREGTSIDSRVLSALSPSFAKPDERQMSDIILFAKKYAAYLNYYNQANVLAEDWQPFMKMDISVTLATLMSMDIRKSSDYKKLLYKNIKNAVDDSGAKKQFTFIFDLIFSLIKISDEQYGLLPANSEYSAVIKNIFSKKILSPLVNIKKLFDDFIAESLIDTGLVLDATAPVSVSAAANFNLNSLSEWTMPLPFISLTVPALPTAKDKIVYIINHNLFNAQIESLLNSLSMIIFRAAKLFDETLENFPSHSPHYALFITFIKLFRHAQDDLNKYSQRHLDFYYKDVMRLKNKNPQPDAAHLVFELQKPILKHLLKKDILFKGGKDISGKEINYALTGDVVLNKASVAKIHALQMLKNSKEILYASPIANSEDGQGAKLISPDKSWFTFGNPEKKQHAAIGFAIASNILFLNEGERTITVTVKFENSINNLLVGYPQPYSSYYVASITGEKDWLVINELVVDKNTDGRQLIFSFTLAPDMPAIVPYSEKVHKENFETELPLLKFYLNQQNPAAFNFRLLQQEKIGSINISVDVTGVKDLMLSNDTGTVDAAKPFKPYGDFPGYNASFYIGSKEIFQKDITNIGFDFGNDNIYYKKNAEYLHQGKWHRINNDINTDSLSFAGENFHKASVDFSKNESLTVATLEGFLRLRLSSPLFSKQRYLNRIKTQINNTTVTKSANNPVQYKINIGGIPTPRELVLDSFSLSYSASTRILLNAEAADRYSHFIQLEPFGYSEIKFDNNEPSKKITLLPAKPYDGELLIGLADAEPDSVVNILFHSAEGSSNPLKDFEVVRWHFLTMNKWIAFESHQIIDGTKNFTQSGIVTLSLPEIISNNNSLLEKGLHWIKAVVNKNPDAVCKMILVQSQAALVQLVQDDSKQIEFRQTIPSAAISKLLVSDPAIKTITQPADSFNGRTRETDDHFYVRVSERLRHKQRAITIWDYEHIILEQFQQIYKVRCINHSGFYLAVGDDGSAKDFFCENFPGHVTIITIPDFKNKTGINPLRPYTPAGIRRNIDDYLHTIISPFVKLHVSNPQFEEVQLEFEVSFHENLDPSFYRQLLNDEIEKFLTPWAFDANHEIIFGGKIIKSVLLNFVEERPYVDFVTCFKMHHIIKRSGTVHTEELRDVEEAIGTTARSLLASYFNEEDKTRHIIHSPATCNC